MPPGALAQVLCHLPIMEDENLLIGCNSFADAGVYRVMILPGADAGLLPGRG